MFRKLFQLNYPVDETVEESKIRYMAICELSEELAGVQPVPSLRCSNLEEAWRKLKLFWERHPDASGEHDFSCPYSIWKTYYIVESYEEAVTYLIPDASNWTEEWADRAMFVNCIKDLYGVDFSNDFKSLDALINATRHRNDISTCAWYLYKSKACSQELLHRLWGDNYVEKLQYGFLDLYKRYKAAKRNKTARGRYGQSAFMDHWIYKQIDAWRHSEVIELSDKVRTNFFNISLGI